MFVSQTAYVGTAAPGCPAAQIYRAATSQLSAHHPCHPEGARSLRDWRACPELAEGISALPAV